MPEFEFTDEQNERLEKLYFKNPYPTFQTMKLLAQAIHLTNLAISVWFMLRREREQDKENMQNMQRQERIPRVSF